MSKAVPAWMSTFHWLKSRPDGATWREICYGVGINRGTWRAHRWYIIRFLEGTNLALPDATRETGFRFRITDEWESADKPDLHRGRVADVGHMLARTRRSEHEAEVRYEAAVRSEPLGKRSLLARECLADMVRIALARDQLEKELVKLGGTI